MAVIAFARALAAVAIVMLVACGDSTSPDDELSAARRRWAAQAPPAYEVVLFRSCECLQEGSGPVLVRVRNGTVEARQYVSTGNAVSSTYESVFPNVEGLFEIVADALRRDADRLEVRYDPVLSYPTRIVVDYDRIVADDEFTLTATAFRSAPVH